MNARQHREDASQLLDERLADDMLTVARSLPALSGS
jgi:hypothetical protein